MTSADANQMPDYKVTNESGKYIFLSYSRRDAAFVERLFAGLSAEGINVWIDRHGLHVGMPDWEDAIRAALQRADGLVLVASPESRKSTYVKDEVVIAKENGKRIYPVWASGDRWLDCVPIGFGSTQFVDMRGDKYADGLETLVKAIKQGSENLALAPADFEEQVSKLVVKPKSPRNYLWVVAVATVAITVVLIALLLQIGNGSNPAFSPSLTATHTLAPTLTSTPDRMSAGTFNVVVTGFGYVDATGQISQSDYADNISELVYDSLGQLSDVQNIRGPSVVGWILDGDASARSQHAKEIAELYNADVVVYGTVAFDGFYDVYDPEIYVNAPFAVFEPDIGGETTLPDIDFIRGDPEARTDLADKLTLIRMTTSGLAKYFSGRFADAKSTFEQALQVRTIGAEVLYLYAGNAALREPDRLNALQLFRESLLQRPDYGRALIGSGFALYGMANDSGGRYPPLFDTNMKLSGSTECRSSIEENTAPQLLAMQAVLCFDAALSLEATPASADIDVKAHFGRGQVYMWFALNEGDYWDQAADELRYVVDQYERSDRPRQIRIRQFAAHANAWLGLRLIQIDRTNPVSLQQAVAFYERAIELLQADVNHAYNSEWLNRYGDQLNVLNNEISRMNAVTSTALSGNQ